MKSSTKKQKHFIQLSYGTDYMHMEIGPLESAEDVFNIGIAWLKHKGADDVEINIVESVENPRHRYITGARHIDYSVSDDDPWDHGNPTFMIFELPAEDFLPGFFKNSETYRVTGIYIDQNSRSTLSHPSISEALWLKYFDLEKKQRSRIVGNPDSLLMKSGFK